MDGDGWILLYYVLGYRLEQRKIPARSGIAEGVLAMIGVGLLYSPLTACVSCEGQASEVRSAGIFPYCFRGRTDCD